MPGVVQHTMDSLVRAATEAVERGVGGLMLFGVPEHKDALGSGASDPEGVLNQALARLRFELGDSTVIMADLCLDEFTDHGTDRDRKSTRLNSSHVAISYAVFCSDQTIVWTRGLLVLQNSV